MENGNGGCTHPSAFLESFLGCSLQDQMSLGYDALEQKESAIYNMLLMINARIWETVMEGAPIHVRFWKADSKLRRYS